MVEVVVAFKVLGEVVVVIVVVVVVVVVELFYIFW